jgi:penicillin-binding protein 1C
VGREILSENGETVSFVPAPGGVWRLGVEAADVDPRFIEALIAVEDERFYAHTGVDGRAVIRALLTNLRSGRVVSGASTITMQTARLLEPRPRDLHGKVLEAWRAMELERALSKDDILSLYLTLTPYGGNLEGVRAASLSYFGKEPRELTDSEIALLLALPQAPEGRRPDRQPSAAMAGRRAVLQRLAEEGLLSQERAEEAALDPLPSGRRSFPAHAWHVSQRLLRETEDTRIQTTLDLRQQLLLERVLRENALRRDQSTQLAALVVRRRDFAVTALAGSALRTREGGWLDLTARKRSPGSTLKPLIYGLAFEEGIAAPQTIVADMPMQFGSYAPRNFARDFSGELTFADALRHSLNVPAVLLLDQLGPERLAGTIELTGLDAAAPTLPEGGEGLAIALGGIGLSAQDLARLYAGLGAGGIDRPLAFTPAGAAANETSGGSRFLSEEAAKEVLSILRDGPSLAGRLPAHLSADAPKIAFKTGTSYGYRDAWAVGVGSDYVCVVWSGRPDGGASPGETGRQAALPVLFEIFDLIEPRQQSHSRGTETVSATGVARMAGSSSPAIVFPPEGSKLWPKADGAPFILAGRGDGQLSWYADGQALMADRSENVLWSPPGPGFYEITLVDGEGRAAQSRVQVR